MSRDELTFSLPRWPLTRWLTDVGPDVPRDIRVALIRAVYGTLPIFVGGVVNTLAVALLIVWRLPEPIFIAWLAFEVAICSTRIVVLIVSRRRAGLGQPTPTDLNLILAVAWAGSVGFGAMLSLASDDWISAALACLSAGAMVGGTCFRNFAAPRLTGAMIASTLGPICIGAVISGEPVLLITLLQIPIYFATMSVAAFRLNKMMIATMRAERENAFQAHHDGLTGLSNRAGLGAAMEKRRAAPGAGPIAALYLDLDGFKAVNDTHGHAIGDWLLQLVGERVSNGIGTADIAARIGGDEFVVLCQGRSRSELIALAEMLIARLSEPYSCGSVQVGVGVSIGIAVALGQDEELSSLLRAADVALYRSKALGKGRCTLAPGQRGSPASEAAFLPRLKSA